MTQKITFSNSEVFYQVHGGGQAVLLVHGFAETGDVWERQIEFLKKFCMVLVPDLPGTGRSAGFDAPVTDTDVSDFADCIFAILNREEIERCIMLGHSMGGYITLAFAEKYPEKLKAFGLVHSTAFADSETKKQTRLKGIRMIDEHGSYAFLKAAIPDLFAEKFKNEHAEKIRQLVEEGKQFTKRDLQGYYYAMIKRPDRTHVLKNSNLPVLFVIGTEDVAAPLNDLLKQVHLCEISYIHILENTGHMSMWEAADTLNEYLEEFVNENS